MKDCKETYRQKFALKDNVKVIKREEYEDILLYQETYIEKLLSQQRKEVLEEVVNFVGDADEAYQLVYKLKSFH